MSAPHRTTIRRLHALFLLLLAAGAVLALCAAPAPALDKGLIDFRLEETRDTAERDRISREIGTTLKSDWVRLMVDWSYLEPTRGKYATVALGRLDALVDGFHAQGVRIILTTWRMPQWAQDSYWWTHPRPGYSNGPRGFYPIRKDALADYADLGEFLATHFDGRVQALECWNEPNMWTTIYPQKTAKDAYFGARTYLGMLRAFHTGVARADTGVKVIAGATAPLGTDDKYRTSPQRFARYLKDHGASSLFDVYSHHPYATGGSRDPSPDGWPNDAGEAVVLANLRTLLDLFPSKPFYLTEYGYNTQKSIYFGNLKVSTATQASYLKQAYSYARRYKQVKLMLWYLLYDYKPASGPADTGTYTGLRTSSGTRKAAWYAFRDLR